jgi:hypothetical protein
MNRNSSTINQLNGTSLAGFIKRAKAVMAEERPDVPGWLPRFDDICADHWRFGLMPHQAVDAIAASEGLDAA